MQACANELPEKTIGKVSNKIKLKIWLIYLNSPKFGFKPATVQRYFIAAMEMCGQLVLSIRDATDQEPVEALG